jgi:hypothetical protein
VYAAALEVRPEARIVFLEPSPGMMQEKDVMRCHVPYCEHGDQGDRDSEACVSDRSLITAMMDLSDH